MFMKRSIAAGLLTLALLVRTVPVGTIMNGQLDNNRHPYVGLAFQPIPSRPGFVTLCSGSALSSTVFLTAAHCFDPALDVTVVFNSGPPFTIGSTGTFHPHPDWCLGCGPGLPGFDTHDVAVIELDQPVLAGPFAMLPSEGLVDLLPMKTDIDVVGYGVQGFARGGGTPTPIIDLNRHLAASQLILSNHQQSSEFIKLTLNPAQGKGGTCFGDSGGPNLLPGGEAVVLAINSYGTNDNCAGVGYSTRIDVPDILKFINDFLKK
jgi:Trypsin